MARINKYISGDHWVECQVCGHVYRASFMRKRWDGAIVCLYDFEQRHPQDFVRGKTEDQSAKGLVNPETSDTFTSGFCTTRDAVAGEAVAGCAIAGMNLPNTVPTGTFNNTL
jgi:hypothetical protein